MTEWQPIDTAPKDGTTILISSLPSTFRGEPIPARVTVGEWNEWVETCSEYHASTGVYLGRSIQGGGAEWASWDGGFTDENPPTHWMPLPEPPENTND